MAGIGFESESASEKCRHQFRAGAIGLNQATTLKASLDEDQGWNAQHAKEGVEAIRVLRLVFPITALTDRALVEGKVWALTGDGSPQHGIGGDTVRAPARSSLGVFSPKKQEQPRQLIGHKALGNCRSINRGGAARDGHRRMLAAGAGISRTSQYIS
jgi:hypothetical protein